MDFTICEHRLFNTRSFDLPLDKTPENLFLKRRLKKEEVQNLMKHLGFQALNGKEPIEDMSMGEKE